MEIDHPKKIGIWLDNAQAHLIEFSIGDMTSTKIVSGFTHELMEESLEHGENRMHTKKSSCKPNI